MTVPALSRLVAAAPPGPDDLAGRLEAYARAAAGALADNTVRALVADVRVYTAWCAAAGREPLPAGPDTVAAFLDAMAGTRAPATVRRYRASIATLHRAAGVADPTRAEIVRLAVKRMHRARGSRQTQAPPLVRAAVDRLLAAADAGGRAIDRRDAALLAVAYDTLLRRGELVGLRLEDLVRAPDGSATILVRRSKTDGAGDGAMKYVAADTLRRIDAYLAATGVAGGALFRALSKAGRPGRPLQGQEVPRLFRRLAEAAGLAPLRPSAHSTRVGACQDMLAAGFELPEIMQAGSWKSAAMVARYGERLLVRRGAARKLATLQNRS